MLFKISHVRRALDVCRTIVKSGPYRIHSHFAWGNAFVAAYTAQLLGIPFSLTVHADDIFGLSEKEERELRWLLSRADKVITISNFNKTYLVDKGICAEEKIEVIHCGISLHKFLLDDHAYQEGLFRIVTVPSGFVEKKGLDLLLKAVQDLIKHYANIELIIVGRQCDKRKKYENEIIDTGIASIVKFTGAIPQKDLAELYKNCHAFVLPCIVDSKGKMDGIPVSLMEAMAVGIPVVSTEISGIPELIEHEKEGLLAKPRDVVSLYTQLRRLIGEANRSILLTKAARLKIELEFNIEVIAQKLIASLALR